MNEILKLLTMITYDDLIRLEKKGNQYELVLVKDGQQVLIVGPLLTVLTQLNNFMKKNLTRKELCKIIMEEVSMYYNIPIDEITKETRKREIVQARQFAHTIMYDLYHQSRTMSLQFIDSEIGNKDHATVLHSKKTINNLIDTDKNVRNDFYKILENFKKRVDEEKGI